MKKNSATNKVCNYMYTIFLLYLIIFWFRRAEVLGDIIQCIKSPIYEWAILTACRNYRGISLLNKYCV
jgi:hypothetical protein